LHNDLPSTILVPENQKQAYSSKYASYWKKAELRELAALEKNNTWIVVDSKGTKRPLKGRWVYDIKRDSKNKIKYFKARYVAKGYLQKKFIDYNETFSACSQMRTFRLILALSISMGLKVRHWDVSCAFTNGILEEVIYLESPSGYPIPEGKILLLKKSIYGLKQASRVWGFALRDALLSLGFVQCKSDTCLYHATTCICFISVHVDDFVVATADDVFYAQIFARLSKIFQLKDLGIIEQYIGISVLFTGRESVHLDQSAYIERMAARFGVSDCKKASLPMVPGTKLSTANAPATPEEVSTMSTTPYRAIVGSLLYAARGCRPDISFSVSCLSRFNQNPGSPHWLAAKRVLCYLLHSARKGVSYVRMPEIKIEMYSDSDWGADEDTRRSVSAYVCRVSGGPVSWLSRSQKTAALSSCEAEFLALSDALKEVLWLRQALLELDVKFTSPIEIKIDNQAAINLSKNAVNHQRTKHIDIRYFRIREEVEEGRVSVAYVPTNENISDLLTKAVTAQQFFSLLEEIVV
jgi:hypothetical protein